MEVEIQRKRDNKSGGGRSVRNAASVMGSRTAAYGFFGSDALISSSSM